MRATKLHHIWHLCYTLCVKEEEETAKLVQDGHLRNATIFACTMQPLQFTWIGIGSTRLSSSHIYCTCVNSHDNIATEQVQKHADEHKGKHICTYVHSSERWISAGTGFISLPWCLAYVLSWKDRDNEPDYQPRLSWMDNSQSYSPPAPSNYSYLHIFMISSTTPSFSSPSEKGTPPWSSRSSSNSRRGHLSKSSYLRNSTSGLLGLSWLFFQ